MEKTILLLGTLDTKGLEYGFVKERITEQGHRTIVLDAGVRGRPLLKPDITRDEVAMAAGSTVQDIIEQ